MLCLNGLKTIGLKFAKRVTPFMMEKTQVFRSYENGGYLIRDDKPWITLLDGCFKAEATARVERHLPEECTPHRPRVGKWLR